MEGLDWNGMLDSYGPMVMDYGVKLVGVFVLLIIARIVAGSARKVLWRSLERANFDSTLTKFFGNMVYWTVLIIAILAVLGIFGIQTASFAALIAAAGLAVGLAFQGSLSNFSAGVMLLVFRPFKIGDVVRTAGEFGKIESIDLFTTSMDTFDNRRIILPNSSIFGSTIENVSFHDTRRVDVNVGASYDADLDATRAVLMEAANSIDDVLPDPAPAVVLLELGGSSVDWVVRVWCNAGDFWPVKDALTRAVKMKMDEKGIGIPFPQLDVHLDQPVSQG